jgi:translation initiation factor IF-3
LSRPFPSRSSSSSGPFVRVNGKIRAREVRVIGVDDKQLGILSLGDALNMARANGVDLVEIAPNATPPVCRLVDYGKYRYEQAKRDKESKKHQHATKVKEVQLSPKIDPHDLGVKIEHAVDFLCEDMKVKVTLKFRGREMAHTEFGFQVVNKFLADIAPYGHPDFAPKLIGRGINVMISPLPRNKRAKNPRAGATVEAGETSETAEPVRAPEPKVTQNHRPAAVQIDRGHKTQRAPESESGGFANNPFAQIEINR